MPILSSYTFSRNNKLMPPDLFLHQIEKGNWIKNPMIVIQSVHTNRLFKP